MKQIKKHEDDQCCGCFRSKQTRKHLFKHCSTWRPQQNAMWALVEKETKRGKRKWSMAELFADERCSGAILEFIRTTDVGRKIPVARAVTVSVASTAEQECPRENCGSDPGATLAIEAEGTEAVVSEVRLVFGLPPAGEIPMRLERRWIVRVHRVRRR